MKRLLPLRQVNESDVVNLFALEAGSVNNSLTGVGDGDAGVFVKVTTGNFDADPVGYEANSYLGKTDYPHIGYSSMYPTVNKTVAPATDGDVPLGITLWETANYDENGESLLRYPQKAKEMQAVVVGQAVPIATRGIFKLHSNAFDGPASSYSLGGGIVISAVNDGKVTGASITTNFTGATGEYDVTYNTAAVFGTVIGTGSRSGGLINGRADAWSGDFLVVQLH
jgi:hypothetical protein